VLTSPGDLVPVQQALEAAKIKYSSAERQMIPVNTVQISGTDANHVLRLMDMLEDHDDVQNVWANFDIDDEELENRANQAEPGPLSRFDKGGGQ